MPENRYEAVALGGPVFEIKTFSRMEDKDGNEVEVLSNTHRVQADMAVKQLGDAEIKVKNAKAVVAAIKLAAAVAVKEAADEVKAQAGETPTE